MIFYAAFAAPAGFLGLMWLAMLRSKKGRGGSNVARAVVIVLVLWMFGPFAVMMLGMGISMGLSHAGFSGGATSVAVSPDSLARPPRVDFSRPGALLDRGGLFLRPMRAPGRSERLVRRRGPMRRNGPRRLALTLGRRQGPQRQHRPRVVRPLSIVALLLPFFGLHYLISSKGRPTPGAPASGHGRKNTPTDTRPFRAGGPWGGFQAFVLMIAIASLATLVLCPISPRRQRGVGAHPGGDPAGAVVCRSARPVRTGQRRTEGSQRALRSHRLSDRLVRGRHHGRIHHGGRRH